MDIGGVRHHLASTSEATKLTQVLVIIQTGSSSASYCAVFLPLKSYISDIFSNADDSLFKMVLKNSRHVLYPYLPENQYLHCHRRQRPHNKALIPKRTCLSYRDSAAMRSYVKLLWPLVFVVAVVTVSRYYSVCVRSNTTCQLQYIQGGPKNPHCFDSR